MIATTPALREEVERVLPALREKAHGPAGREGVRRVIGKRLALFPPRDLGEGAIEAWWEDYIAALRDVPESALEAGMQAWIKRPDSRFMPKPGELRELAMTSENKAVRAYQRAQGAMTWEPPKTYTVQKIEPPKLRQPTSEDKERVRRWAKEYATQVEDKKPILPELPPNHGETDEKGITAEMRALMDRRKQG